MYISYMLSVLELCTDLKFADTGDFMFCFNDFRIYLYAMLIFQHALCYIEAIKLHWLPFELNLCCTVPLLSGQPLLSSQFSKSRGWPLNRGRTVIVLLYIERKKVIFWPFTNGKQHKACKLDMITLSNHASRSYMYMTWLPVTLTWLPITLTWFLYNLQLWRRHILLIVTYFTQWFICLRVPRH